MMRLIDAENLLKDYAFIKEEEEENSILTPDVKSFYRESVEDTDVAPTIKVALVEQTEKGYEIIKVLE